jgi:RNA polymerase sigma-70 factor (ECF subfamily)
MSVLLSVPCISEDTRSASVLAHFLRRRRKNLAAGDADEDVTSLLVQMGPESAISLPHALDAESRAWVDGLRATGPEQARTLERLHDLLLRAAHAEARRRSHLYPEIGGPELDDLCSQAAGDAVLAVTAKVAGYRGASRFTTWAYAFAIYEISVKLRRHAWRRGRIPTADDDATWDRLVAQPASAQTRTESAELLRDLRLAIAEELTPRQRQVFVAVALNDVEIDVVAGQLDSTRGAVYKVLHDARRKLRLRLEREEHLEPMETR